MVRIAALLPLWALGAAGHGEAKCRADTGGTCKLFGCRTSRRGAECDTATSKCVCPEGTCSSEEGICVPQQAVCSADTGGTCRAFGCDDWRRGAKCNTTAGYKCLCPHGMCSSMDGSCVGGKTREAASQKRLLTGDTCNMFFGVTMLGCPSEAEVGPTECVAGKCICKEGLYYFCHLKSDNRTWSGCSKECRCQKSRPADSCTRTAPTTSAPAASLQV
ncbi:unnamed protein product [Prorocentrum cordatum]|uniref:EGF-like domain-containing protein n=1 Tax=Prorocentrum cordatum TaxID=2364126 RepID=A0ABN9PDW4_9DINO|nr:unnamed protein product [Polarella glacialis]